MSDKFATCFLGMAIIGAIGVSMGFPPFVGGALGFFIGYILFTLNK